MTDTRPDRPSDSGKPLNKKSGSRKSGKGIQRARPTSPAGQAPAQSPGDRAPAAAIPVLTPLLPGEKTVVPEAAIGQTVLAVLRALRPGESWSRLRDQLRRGLVTLNGAVCLDEARRIASQDVLGLLTRPGNLPQACDVVIRFVDLHVVVVEKPSGMMTHRRPEERNWSAERKARQPTLDEVLNEMLNGRGVRSNRPRQRVSSVHCVHRLDRDTSGLLVFARNADAETHLVSQFRRHSVHRVYWAIVQGTPNDGTIVSNLVRDRGDGRRGSVRNPEVGQRAVTHIRVLEQLGDHSLVECQLETGRTNQIRIHMAEAGHLVCGDSKYHQPFGAEAIRDNSGAPRLALHAAELGFVHPVSGEEIFFQMPFPPDLEELANRLGGSKAGKGRPGL